MKTTYHLTDKSQIPELVEFLKRAAMTGEHIIKISKRKKHRTLTQNASLHVYCEIVSEKMRDAGITCRGLFDKMSTDFDLDATPEIIKDIFRKVGKKQFNKDSTADLTTVEIQETYLAVDKGFAQLFGVTTPWPSNEPPIF